MKETLLEFINFLKPYIFDWDNDEHINYLVDKFLDKDSFTMPLIDDGFDPPPWNMIEHPEKTEGWIEYQKTMKYNLPRLEK